MARLVRLYIPGMPQHVILEAQPSALAFRDGEDLTCFAETLRQASKAHGFAIHAYALMPQAVHLLGSPTDADAVPKTMQALGRRYVAIHNRRHRRDGPLWEGRYRATVIDPEQHLLMISRLMESLSGDVALLSEDGRSPPSARRSSYPHHIGLAIDPTITDHPLYWALGNTPFERQRAYRSLAELPLPDDVVAHVIDATRKGWILGDAAFRARCERLANRRIVPLPRGRPKKAQEAV